MKTHEMKQRAMEVAQERKDQGLAVNKTPWEKIAENPAGMRARVNGKCFECMGWEVDTQEMPAGVKGDIRDCTATRCPLHKIRPYKP